MSYIAESPKLKHKKMRYKKASMKRRVTVHFGDVRVVVPCQDEDTTVADLAEAAAIRYKKATGKMETDVRILRMQCISDEGILDMDDKIVDVFDEARDQILAIYDEQSPNASDATDYNNTTPTAARGPVVGRVRDSVVEIVSLENPPSNGLRVSSSVTNNRTPESSGAAATTAAATSFAVIGGKSGEKERQEPPVRSSLRSDTSTPTRHRVTLSPEVEKKLASGGEKDTRLTRTSARKSRLTESFFDAVERLEDAREAAAASSRMSPMMTRRQRAYLRPALDPENTVIIFPDDDLTPMGIEVTGVQDDPSSTNGRLSAVQILRIEPDGRVGLDGRLKVGDNIVEIDSRPVYQMSIVRARAYLSELQSHYEPSLTISRPLSTFADSGSLLRDPATSSIQSRPILSALQQANTQHIGHTKIVELKKTSTGFGFTVTGRETAKGERLFYIGTVKPNGAALGHLRAGDRLLELNGEPTADLTQAEVVDRLKRADVGETVTFLVSRLVQPEEDDEKKSNSSERENQPPTRKLAVIKPVSDDKKSMPSTSNAATTTQCSGDVEELELVIPLNDTGSAGLGVSLKARVTVRTNGTRQDCGIFIKNVLHGGAAHKDGRLRVNDRIVGIEELRLDGETNATASEAVSRRLKAIGPTAKYVRLFIQRARTPQMSRSISQPQAVSRVCVDGDEGPSRISVIATESTSSEGKPSPSDGLDSDIGRLDESELANVSDPFSREAPTRKSLSEKRGMGATSDPHHIKLFQDIKHQRQTSAPLSSAMTTSLSFHGQGAGRSASQRAAARARSQSVHPRAPAPPKIMKMSTPTTQVEPRLHNSAPAASEKRRSQSAESTAHENRATPKTHSAMPYRGALTSDSFRQATDYYDLHGQAPPAVPSHHPFPPGSPVMVKQRSASREKDKQRRKSLGGLNVMKSFLGFGKSREESPSQRLEGKSEEMQRLRDEEEERKRIREHYDRLREKELEANRSPHSLTPGAVRREPHRVYASPNYNYSPQFSTTSSPSTDPPLIVANSRFYFSLRARPECRPVFPNTIPTISSTDTTYTAIQPQNRQRRKVVRSQHLEELPRPIIRESPMEEFRNHRPITTPSQVRSPFMVAREYPTTKSTPPITVPTSHRSKSEPPFPIPTTTVCSTLGLPIAEKESARHHSSKPHTEHPCGSPPIWLDGYHPTSPVHPVTPNMPNSPDMHLRNHHNFITDINTRNDIGPQFGPRVSLRARKKRRGGVQSALISCSRQSLILSPSPCCDSFEEKPRSPTFPIKSPQISPIPVIMRRSYPSSGSTSPSTPFNLSTTLRTHSRTVTAINDPVVQDELDPVYDYCRVWNDWNERTGGTLPRRRSRPRPLVSRQLHDDITDC